MPNTVQNILQNNLKGTACSKNKLESISFWMHNTSFYAKWVRSIFLSLCFLSELQSDPLKRLTVFFFFFKQILKLCPLWLANMNPVCQQGYYKEVSVHLSGWFNVVAFYGLLFLIAVFCSAPSLVVFSRFTHSLSVDSFVQSLTSLLIADYFLPLIFPPLWLSAPPWLVSPVPR